LKVLLNSKDTVEPMAGTAIYSLSSLPDTSYISQSPLLKLQQQQVVLSEQQYKLEKSKLLPSFNAGYNNSTIIGWQAMGQNTEKYFGSSKRFSSVTAGIGIPVFSRAQRSRINASNVLTRQRRQELDATRQQLNANLEDAIRIYLRNRQLVESYRVTMLPNAVSTINVATNKLNAGEIGYLNWVILINQAIQIRSDYFNTVQQLKE
jgi:cobalt-zinc-cadmium resistance protein CzcA